MRPWRSSLLEAKKLWSNVATKIKDVCDWYVKLNMSVIQPLNMMGAGVYAIITYCPFIKYHCLCGVLIPAKPKQSKKLLMQKRKIRLNHVIPLFLSSSIQAAIVETFKSIKREIHKSTYVFKMGLINSISRLHEMQS